MPCCIVRTCKHETGREGQGFVTFHVIPRDEELRSKWLRNVQRSDLFGRAHRGVVCSEHFSRSCFKFDSVAKLMLGTEKYRLIRGSVPEVIETTSKNDDPQIEYTATHLGPQHAATTSQQMSSPLAEVSHSTGLSHNLYKEEQLPHRSPVNIQWPLSTDVEEVYSQSRIATPEPTYNAAEKENNGPSPTKRMRVSRSRCVTASTQTEPLIHHIHRPASISTGTQTQTTVETKQCQAPQDLFDIGKGRLLEHSYCKAHADEISSTSISNSDSSDILNDLNTQMTSTPRVKVIRNHPSYRTCLTSHRRIESPIKKCIIDDILEEEIDTSFSSVGTMEDNETMDPTFTPDSDSHSSESSDSLDEISDRKYIVYGCQLQELFSSIVCRTCQSPAMPTHFMTKGSELITEFQCINGHDIVWKSQPEINRMPMGNLQIAAAVLFGGCTFSSIRTFASLLNLKFIQKTTFNNLQAEYLFPVIHETWENHQTTILAKHKDVPVSLAGDGRCDSPGFSAKYGTYTAMTMDTGLILDFNIVQVTEAGNSVAMEKLGLQRVMKKLEDSEVDVGVLATDRHTQIRKYLRTEKPTVDHQFDVWHMAKSIGKKISKKAKQKDCKVLGQWRKSIINHLWFSSGTCGGDPDVLTEKWTSIIHHTVNRHVFPGNHIDRCGHEQMTDFDEKKTKWMTEGSTAHEALKNVVLDKATLKDVRQLTRFCHTGKLESYHSLMLKYCPKRLHFSMEGMTARTELAALDNNMNVGRPQATIKKGRRKGEPRYKTEFPKMSKQWVAKPIYEEKSYEYAHEMVERVVSGKLNNDITAITKRNLPRNIASIDRPSKADLIDAHTSRFR